MPKPNYTTITIRNEVMNLVKKDFEEQKAELTRNGITTLNQYIVRKLLN